MCMCVCMCVFVCVCVTVSMIDARIIWLLRMNDATLDIRFDDTNM